MPRLSRLDLAIVAGVVLVVALLSYRFVYAQSAPTDYLKKAESHVMAMSYFDPATQNNPEKRLQAFRDAQKFFSDTKAPKGFAAFHARSLFAAKYCAQVGASAIEAKKKGEDKNIFSAGILIDMFNGCLFASQDALTLWLQAKGE